MTPSLDTYTAPECQMRSCASDAETTRDHPEHGEIQLCETCAGLWTESGSVADA